MDVLRRSRRERADAQRTLAPETRDLLIMVEFDANVGLHDGSDAGARAWLEDLRPAGCEALMSPRVPTNRVCPRRGGVGAVRREEVRRAADHTNRSAEGGA